MRKGNDVHTTRNVPKLGMKAVKSQEFNEDVQTLSLLPAFSSQESIINSVTHQCNYIQNLKGFLLQNDDILLTKLY